jgi:hypothetical protein
MRTFVIQLWRKPFTLSLLLAALLGITLWNLMQPLSRNSPVALAADEGVRFINEDNIALMNRDIRLLCFQGAGHHS